MSKTIKVVYLDVNEQEPSVVEVENTAEELQKLVDGAVEKMTPEVFDNFDNRLQGLYIGLNDDAKFNGFKENIIVNRQLLPWSIIYGHIFISGRHGNSFESIPEDRIKGVISVLKQMKYKPSFRKRDVQNDIGRSNQVFRKQSSDRPTTTSDSAQRFKRKSK